MGLGGRKRGTNARERSSTGALNTPVTQQECDTWYLMTCSLLAASHPRAFLMSSYCAFKSDRLKSLERRARDSYMEAFNEANTDGKHLVHSHAHLFRWKYPHTLGRMKAYGVGRAREAKAEAGHPE
jgi:hypothetical protein